MLSCAQTTRNCYGKVATAVQIQPALSRTVWEGSTRLVRGPMEKRLYLRQLRYHSRVQIPLTTAEAEAALAARRLRFPCLAIAG